MIHNWKLILTDTLYFWYPIFLISDTLYFWYPIFLIPNIFPIPNISDTRYIWYGTWYFWYPIFIIPDINDIQYFWYFWYFWCMNLFLMPNRGHYYAACAIFILKTNEKQTKNLTCPTSPSGTGLQSKILPSAHFLMHLDAIQGHSRAIRAHSQNSLAHTFWSQFFEWSHSFLKLDQLWIAVAHTYFTIGLCSVAK